MKKNLFFIKNNNNTFIFILLIILSIFIVYFISFYLNINRKIFTIKKDTNVYYIVPDDKEGEKVKFINKKRINDLKIFDDNIDVFMSIDNLGYTIQLFSDSNYNILKDYYDNLTKLKSQLFTSDNLFIFSINSSLGTDYFLTFGNYETISEARSNCKKNSFIKKCLIINPQK